LSSPSVAAALLAMGGAFVSVGCTKAGIKPGAVGTGGLGGDSGNVGTSGSGGSSGGLAGTGGTGGSPLPPPPPPPTGTAGAGGTSTQPRLTDFPAEPILDPSAPADAATTFEGAAPRTDGAPCIVSPIPGTLMPRNWLRPRFEIAAASGENLFEIQLSVDGFAHPLRIYTAQTSAALDAKLWDQLRLSAGDRTISVSVRALTLTNGTVALGPSAPATTSFTVAPVDAPGKIVYWALADDMGTLRGSLKGFGIGEEGVQDVLVPSQVASRKSNETCVGCHTATPDGFGVGFSMGPSDYFNNISDIRQGTAGSQPSYANSSGMAAIRTLRGIPAYSKAHWADGDRMVLLSDTGTLNWVQVDGAARGTLARTGDTRKASEPSWSHDGEDVVYVSGNDLIDGRLDDGPADLYVVPYANRAGGGAKPLAGAADSAATEYYPAFSPDDTLVAFTRIAGSGNTYSTPAAEVFVVPFKGGNGGTALRLAANDAAACQSGLASPGLTNDWPKWSPRAVTAGGKTYYWLTFSSKRAGTSNAQIYVAGVIKDAAGNLTSTPALHLWNQPATEGNHTPSWDDFAIPPITID
jgi:hypothetical protein